MQIPTILVKPLTGFCILWLSLLSQQIAWTQKAELNWTHFRGSGLNGIVTETGFPQNWSDSTNIAWKAVIPEKGWSSPVLFGNQIWCTSASADGKELYAVCTDFETGENIYTIEVFNPDTVYRIHPLNSHATPSPCIEKDFVYVHFGTYGTACINTGNGQIVWKRTDLNCTHVQGPGSSPIIYKDLLILHLEGNDVQFVTALNKKTGETVWKTDRPASLYESLLPIGKKAYITPVVINVNGRDLLISNGSAVCIAYDVQTGEEVWRIAGGEDTTVAMPAESEGIIYFFTSNLTSPEGEKFVQLVAADPKGIGDITHSNILWKIKLPVLQLSSPLVIHGLVYVIDTRSNLLCIDAVTGEIVWSEKLKGKYHSSPVYVDGKIYFSSTQGETYVIKEGRKLDIISVNTLDGEIWTTPAFIRNSILLRTSKYLYKIQML